MTFDPSSLRQTWPAPARPMPIVTIGAGSIVVDAHFPAYRKGGFPIAGVFDLNPDRAKTVGEKFGVRVFDSLDEALETDNAIFDVATPPAAHLAVLERVPVGAGVLIQKPMGSDLDEATKILKVCRERKLKTAVNFQLRFSPMMLAVKDAVDRGLVGRLLDVEVRRVDRHALAAVRLSEGAAAHRDRRPLYPLSRSLLKRGGHAAFLISTSKPRERIRLARLRAARSGFRGRR